jgi:hypothetical protein
MHPAATEYGLMDDGTQYEYRQTVGQVHVERRQLMLGNAQLQDSILLRKTRKDIRILESNVELLRQLIRGWSSATACSFFSESTLQLGGRFNE